MVGKIGSCEEVWREISNYIDGEVDAGLRSAMEQHFRECKRCASVLAGTRNVVALYGDERMLEAPAGFGRRLERRLARSAARASRWLTWEAWLVPVTAMALIAGGLTITNRFAFHGPPKSILSRPASNVPPELQVVVSDGSKVFHVPGCPFIHDKNSERTMTAKEAMQEGYVPCSRCLRQYLKTEMKGSNAMVASDEDADEDHDETLSVGLVTR